MQRQFDQLAALLDDSDVGVRTLGAQGTRNRLFSLSVTLRSRTGVCNALCKFWEAIPTATSKSLLSKLVKDLAFDARFGVAHVCASFEASDAEQVVCARLCWKAWRS